MRFGSALTLAVLGVAVLGASAHAATVVSDTFTTTDQFINYTSTGSNWWEYSASVASRTPDGVAPAGKTYAVGGAYGYWSSVGSSGQTPYVTGGASGVARLDTSVAPMLDLSGVALDDLLTVSADIKVGNTGDGGDAFRGVLLGFWSGPGGGGETNFTGLAVKPTLGAINLVVNGSSTAASTQAIAGTRSTSEFYNLTFTVNRTDGSFVSGSFDGVPLSFTTTAFSGAALNYVGFGVSSSSGGTVAEADNFVVSTNAVPEPAALGLLAAGTAGLLVRRRRAR